MGLTYDDFTDLFGRPEDQTPEDELDQEDAPEEPAATPGVVQTPKSTPSTTPGGTVPPPPPRPAGPKPLTMADFEEAIGPLQPAPIMPNLGEAARGIGRVARQFSLGQAPEPRPAPPAPPQEEPGWASRLIEGLGKLSIFQTPEPVPSAEPEYGAKGALRSEEAFVGSGYARQAPADVPIGEQFKAAIGQAPEITPQTTSSALRQFALNQLTLKHLRETMQRGLAALDAGDWETATQAAMEAAPYAMRLHPGITAPVSGLPAVIERPPAEPPPMWRDLPGQPLNNRTYVHLKSVLSGWPQAALEELARSTPANRRRADYVQLAREILAEREAGLHPPAGYAEQARTGRPAEGTTSTEAPPAGPGPSRIERLTERFRQQPDVIVERLRNHADAEVRAAAEAVLRERQAAQPPPPAPPPAPPVPPPPVAPVPPAPAPPTGPVDQGAAPPPAAEPAPAPETPVEPPAPPTPPQAPGGAPVQEPMFRPDDVAAFNLGQRADQILGAVHAEDEETLQGLPNLLAQLRQYIYELPPESVLRPELERRAKAIEQIQRYPALMDAWSYAHAPGLSRESIFDELEGMRDELLEFLRDFGVKLEAREVAEQILRERRAPEPEEPEPQAPPVSAQPGAEPQTMFDALKAAGWKVRFDKPITFAEGGKAETTYITATDPASGATFSVHNFNAHHAGNRHLRRWDVHFKPNVKGGEPAEGYLHPKAEEIHRLVEEHGNRLAGEALAREMARYRKHFEDSRKWQEDFDRRNEEREREREAPPAAPPAPAVEVGTILTYTGPKVEGFNPGARYRVMWVNQDGSLRLADPRGKTLTLRPEDVRENFRIEPPDAGPAPNPDREAKLRAKFEKLSDQELRTYLGRGKADEFARRLVETILKERAAAKATPEPEPAAPAAGEAPPEIPDVSHVEGKPVAEQAATVREQIQKIQANVEKFRQELKKRRRGSGPYNETKRRLDEAIALADRAARLLEPLESREVIEATRAALAEYDQGPHPAGVEPQDAAILTKRQELAANVQAALRASQGEHFARWRNARTSAREVRQLLDQREAILERLGEAAPQGDDPEAIFTRRRQDALRRILAAEPGLDPRSLDTRATLEALAEHLGALGLTVTPEELVQTWGSELAGQTQLQWVRQAMGDVVQRRAGDGGYAYDYRVKSIEDGRAIQSVQRFVDPFPRERETRAQIAQNIRTKVSQGDYAEAARTAKAYADGLQARTDQYEALGGDPKIIAAGRARVQYLRDRLAADQTVIEDILAALDRGTAPPTPEEATARIETPAAEWQDAHAILDALSPRSWGMLLDDAATEIVRQGDKKLRALVQSWPRERLQAALDVLRGPDPLVTRYQAPPKPKALTKSQVGRDESRRMPQELQHDGKTWWTNGHMLEAQSAPDAWSAFITENPPNIGPLLDKYGEEGLSDAQVVATERALPNQARRGTGEEYAWVATSDHRLLKFNKAYIDHLVSRNPTATLKVEGVKSFNGKEVSVPLALYDKAGNIVGMVMPMQGKAGAPAVIEAWLDATGRWPAPTPGAPPPRAKRPPTGPKGKGGGKKQARVLHPEDFELTPDPGEPELYEGEEAWDAEPSPHQTAYRQNPPTGTTSRNPGGTPVNIPDEEILPRAEIIRKLLELLGVPAFQGRLNMRSAQAWYRVSDRVIRFRLAQDLPTIAHEVGHHLTSLMWPDMVIGQPGSKGFRVVVRNPSAGPLGGDMRPYARELAPLAYPGAASKILEGMAEWVRLYLTDPPMAARTAPRFTQEFERRLSYQPPEVQDALREFREDTRRYYAAPPLARVLAQMQYGPGRASWAGNKWDPHRFYTMLLDSVHPINLAERTLRDRIDPNAAPTFIADMAYLTKGSAGRADLYVRYNTFDFHTKEMNGEGLLPILDGMKWKDVKLFDAYLAAARTLSLYQMRGARPPGTRGSVIPKGGTVDDITGISIKDAQAIVQMLQADFASLQPRMTAWNNRLLDYITEAEIITRDDNAAFKRENPLYVPLHRVPDFEGGGYPLGAAMRRRRWANLPQPIHRFMGTAAQIYSPIESMMLRAHSLIDIADRNWVALSLVRLADRTDYAADILTRVDREATPVATMSLQEMAEHLRKAGFPLDPALFQNPDPAAQAAILMRLSKVITLFRQDQRTPFGENIIAIREKGEPKLVQIKDPELYRSLAGLGPEVYSALTKILAFPAQFLKSTITRMPDFIAANWLRDQLTVGYSPGGVPVLGAIEALFHMAGKTDSWKRFKSSGASQAGFAALSRDKMNLDLKKMTMSPLRQGVRLVYTPLALLQLLSEIAEESTRLGVSLNLERQGLPWPERGRAVRESTQDFQRQGYLMGAFNLITAFWTPWLGGLDRQARLLGGAGQQASRGDWSSVARIMTMASAQALISYLVYQYGKDDERYRDAPDWEKRTHWVLPVGPTTYLVPKGWDLPLTVANLGEMAAEYMDTGGDVVDRNDRLVQLALQIGTQNVIPNIMIPAIEGLTNWSLWRDRPIVPGRLKRLDPSYQYTRHQTEAVKRASKAYNDAIHQYVGKVSPGLASSLKVSPIGIEHLIRGYGGPMGIGVLRLADAGLQSAGLLPPPASPEPAWSLDDWPAIQRFISRYPTTAARPVQRGFERWNAGQEAWTTLQYLKKHGMAEDFRSFRQTHQAQLIDYVVLKPYFEGRKKDSHVGPEFGVEDLYERINRVEKAQLMESEPKAQRMDHITQLMINTVRQGLAAADAAQLNKLPIQEDQE